MPGASATASPAAGGPASFHPAYDPGDPAGAPVPPASPSGSSPANPATGKTNGADQQNAPRPAAPAGMGDAPKAQSKGPAATVPNDAKRAAPGSTKPIDPKTAALLETEEQLRDKLWEAQKLSTTALQRVDSHIDDAIRASSSASVVDPKLFSKIWDSLQSNTGELFNKWEYVDAQGNAVDYDGKEIDKNKKQSIRDQRKAVMRQDGKFRLIKQSEVFKHQRVKEDTALDPSGQPRCSLTNRVCPNLDARMLISETPKEDGDIGGFVRMLVDREVGMVVDLTPYQEKYFNARYAPIDQNFFEIDGVKVECKVAGKEVRNLANRKRLNVIIKRGENAGVEREVQRIHAYNFGNNSRMPGLNKHGPKTLNKLITQILEVAINEPGQAGKGGTRQPGILIHGPDANGDSAMLMTLVNAAFEIELGINAGKICNNELIMRTALRCVAEGRLLGGPSYVQTEEQFALIMETLLRRFSRRIKNAEKAQIKKKAKDAKHDKQGYVPKEDYVSVEAVQQAILDALAKAAAAREASTDKTPADDSKKKPGQEKSAAPSGTSSSSAPNSPPESPTPRSTTKPGVSVKSPLWDDLEKEKTGAESVRMRSCPDPDSTEGDIPHPDATALRYRRGDKSVYLHANEIRFTKKVSPGANNSTGGEPVATARAGRSPRGKSVCEDFLVNAIESREGLFQFVSPSAHRDPAASAEKPMMHLFKEAFKNKGQEGLILGGRYRVESYADMVADGGDFKQIKIEVIDTLNDNEKKSIILTQAGLSFQKNKLRAIDIQRADELMELHLSENSRLGIPVDRDPMVVSYTGIGRNATLIAYRQVCQQLKDIGNKDELRAVLKEVVLAGRRDRGPGFIHSAAQMEELLAAVEQAYDDHQTGKGTDADDRSAGGTSAPRASDARPQADKEGPAARAANSDPARAAPNKEPAASGSSTNDPSAGGMGARGMPAPPPATASGDAAQRKAEAESEEKARLNAEQMARREAEEKASRDAAEKAKRDAEAAKKVTAGAAA